MSVTDVSLFVKKLLGVGLPRSRCWGVLIGLYVASWATSFPKAVAAVSGPASSGGNQLTLETVAAIGPKYSPTHPDWVSYLITEPRPVGAQHRSTRCRPTRSCTSRSTSSTPPPGLRNPFLSQVQGTVGGTMTLDGKTVNSIPPEEASHTFAVPELGVFVPLPGVSPKKPRTRAKKRRANPRRATTARSPSASAPARRAATTGSASSRARAGFIFGNGGPMQTLGYMDGFIDVV